MDGKQLRISREELGLTQTELARVSGVSRTIINQFEKGHKIPKRETILKIDLTLKKLYDEKRAKPGGANFDTPISAADFRATVDKNLIILSHDLHALAEFIRDPEVPYNEKKERFDEVVEATKWPESEG